MKLTSRNAGKLPKKTSPFRGAPAGDQHRVPAGNSRKGAESSGSKAHATGKPGDKAAKKSLSTGKSTSEGGSASIDLRPTMTQIGAKNCEAQFRKENVK